MEHHRCDPTHSTNPVHIYRTHKQWREWKESQGQIKEETPVEKNHRQYQEWIQSKSVEAINEVVKELEEKVHDPIQEAIEIAASSLPLKEYDEVVNARKKNQFTVIKNDCPGLMLLSGPATPMEDDAEFEAILSKIYDLYEELKNRDDDSENDKEFTDEFCKWYLVRGKKRREEEEKRITEEEEYSKEEEEEKKSVSTTVTEFKIYFD